MKKIIRLSAGAIILAAAVITEKKEAVFPLPLALFITAFFILGFDVLLRALKNIFRGRVFDENFLMSLATCGAFAIGENTEAAGVMLFYQIGEHFQEMAVEKSKKSIADLMDIRPDYANLIKRGEMEKVAPDTVGVGETILVKPGEKIPLDGVVTQGVSSLDVSSLTGESIPKSVKEDDEVLSGSINRTGVLKIRVTKTFGESTVSKIIDLVENAQSKKAKTENFITVFARYYTPVVVVLAVMLAFLPPLFLGGEKGEWIRRALVFLVISCPCALVLSIPMGFFAGLGRAAKSGILVKGGNYLEAFNHVKIAVFDKTGTLTKGVFKVTRVESEKGFSKSELIELAATAEVFSNHPIALSVINAYGKEIDRSKLSCYTELSGLGVSVKKEGIIIYAGNLGLVKKTGLAVDEIKEQGTVIYVATEKSRNDSEGFSKPLVEYAGYIVIKDEIKEDSKRVISALKNKKIKTVMLTGDNPRIAGEVARETGIGEFHAGLLPHEKVEKMENLAAQKKPKEKIVFIGDGINDAPVLAMADIGIAMGGLGSDAAIEAADAVFMTDEPARLVDVMDIARFTKRIVWQNIVFALVVKTLFLIFGAFGLAGMWEAVFADVGVALLAVLNSTRIIRLKFKGFN